MTHDLNPVLFDEEIETIDTAGYREIRRRRAKNVFRGVAIGGLTIAALLKLGGYFFWEDRDIFRDIYIGVDCIEVLAVGRVKLLIVYV